ncbi:MAG: MFS transporter [Candidatus Eisenbacteria bacterium]|nr:MFS transporter [Candidatus Eisenbacteria bacterium]
MHRRTYVVLFIAVFASTMGVGFIGPLLPLYARDLGAAGLSLGMIFAGFSVARFGLSPFIGRLSDKHGRKIFLAIGLAVYSCFSFAYMMAETASHLVLVRVLHGASSGMVIPVAQAYVAEIAPEGREGTFMGAFMVSLFTAFGIGPLLGGPLADRFGMETPFYAMGGLSALALVLVLLFLPELGLHRERWEQRVPIRSVLAHTLVVALMVFRSSVAFGRGLVIPFLPFVAESRGASLSVIGVLLATNILLAGAMQIPFGKLADRVPRTLLMGMSMVGSAAVIFAIPFCETVMHLFLLQVATGIVSALGFPAAIAVASMCGRKLNGMGTVMALFSSGMSIGLILGPLSGGVAERIFGLDFVFKGGSLVVVLGFIAFVLLIRKAHSDGLLESCFEASPEKDGA